MGGWWWTGGLAVVVVVVVVGIIRVGRWPGVDDISKYGSFRLRQFIPPSSGPVEIWFISDTIAFDQESDSSLIPDPSSLRI